MERAIKWLTVDLRGEQQTHRDVHRAEARLGRKLPPLHLLLVVTASA